MEKHACHETWYESTFWSATVASKIRCERRRIFTRYLSDLLRRSMYTSLWIHYGKKLSREWLERLTLDRLPNPIICDENHTKVASHTNPKTFSIEDVFFTGIVRVKAGLPEPVLANNNRQLCTHILDLDRLEKVKKIRKWSMKIIPSYFPAWYTWYKIWFISYERTMVFDFCKSHFIPAVECLMDYKKYQKYDNYYTTWSI